MPNSPAPEPETDKPDLYQGVDHAWAIYNTKPATLHSPPELAPREFRDGFAWGTWTERHRQKEFVHPAIMRIQELVTFADLEPELWAYIKRENPELIARIRTWFERS
jgi:hypothetical protein